MKALAAEMTKTFGAKLQGLGITVKELTGDMQLTKTEISKTQVLITPLRPMAKRFLVNGHGPKWAWTLPMGVRDMGDWDMVDQDMVDQDMGDRDMGDRDIGNWDISNWDIGVRGMHGCPGHG